MRLNEDKSKLIETLYKEMYYDLVSYANAALADGPLAEEAVQDTFRIACAKSDVLAESKNPHGWLFTVLKYVVKNIKRSKARMSMLFVSAIEFEEDRNGAVDEESMMLMYSDLIPEDDFRLLKSIALDGHTILEAADELGIGIEACKKRFHRAKEKLRKALEK